MARKVVVTLSAEEEKLYKDDSDCFGAESKDETYCAEDDNCSPDACPFSVNCKKLSEGAEVKFESDNDSEDVGNDEDIDDSEDDDTKVDRKIVLNAVLKVCEDKHREPKVMSTATRDKVFLGDDDVFVVTKRALKINRLQSGDKLGIDADCWEKDNKGIVVDYNANIDFEKVVELALDRLYIESLPKPVKEAVKNNLFDNVEEEPKPEPVVSKPVAKREVTSVEEPMETDNVDLGEPIKILKIISYSNGYNEVSVISKSSVEEILNSIKGILG